MSGSPPIGLPEQPGLFFCSPGCIPVPCKHMECKQKEQNTAGQAKQAEQSRTQKGQSSLAVGAAHGRGLACVLQVGPGVQSKWHCTPWCLALGHPNGGCKRAEQSRTEQNTKRAGVAHCKGHRLGSCALDEPKSTIRGGNQLHGPCMGSSTAIPMMDANSRAGTACMCVPMEWIAATTGVAHSTGGPHVIKQAKKCTPSGKNMQELRLPLKIHSRAEQEQNRAEQEQNRKFDTKECDFHSGQWAVGFRG